MSDSTSLLHSAFISKEECVCGGWLGVGICVSVVACFVEQRIVYWCFGGFIGLSHSFCLCFKSGLDLFF